jgi:hypothetical protein
MDAKAQVTGQGSRLCVMRRLDLREGKTKYYALNGGKGLASDREIS